MAERVAIAKIVQRLGLGDYLDHFCSPKELRETTIKVYEDPCVPKNLSNFSKIIK